MQNADVDLTIVKYIRFTNVSILFSQFQHTLKAIAGPKHFARSSKIMTTGHVMWTLGISYVKTRRTKGKHYVPGRHYFTTAVNIQYSEYYAKCALRSSQYLL